MSCPWQSRRTPRLPRLKIVRLQLDSLDSLGNTLSALRRVAIVEAGLRSCGITQQSLTHRGGDSKRARAKSLLFALQRAIDCGSCVFQLLLFTRLAGIRDMLHGRRGSWAIRSFEDLASIVRYASSLLFLPGQQVASIIAGNDLSVGTFENR
jgi:hypothetical protein